MLCERILQIDQELSKCQPWLVRVAPYLTHSVVLFAAKADDRGSVPELSVVQFLSTQPPND